MAGLHKAKKTKKNRKWDRNRTYCTWYKNTNQREKNKLRRLKKHLVRFPADKVAAKAAEVCKATIKGV